MKHMLSITMASLCESYLKLNQIMKLTPNTTEYTNLRKTLSIEEQQALKQLKQREASVRGPYWGPLDGAKEF